MPYKLPKEAATLIAATNEDKGLMGSTQDTLRETTGALRGEGPWHSVNSEVYHNNPNCQTGNSMDPENVEQDRRQEAL